jgi:hypothetical protein
VTPFHHLRTAAAALVMLVLSAVALGGCAFLEPTPTPSPSETQQVIDTTKYIGGEIDPADTTWTGTDSGGDLTTITLHADGTLGIGYGENHYDYPGDTWRVRDGILRMEVYLDETNGLAQYVGTWNPETRAIDTVMRTTRTAKELTVVLTQEP